MAKMKNTAFGKIIPPVIPAHRCHSRASGNT